MILSNMRDRPPPAQRRAGTPLNTYWPIAPLNHDLVQHEGLDATCIDAGWNAYEDCTRCDYTTFSEAPALGHEYVSQTFAPTCTADGYTVSTCARCSESFTVNEGEKLGHWFGEWQPDGNRHRADCLRSGCGSAPCAAREVAERSWRLWKTALSPS